MRDKRRLISITLVLLVVVSALFAFSACNNKQDVDKEEITLHGGGKPTYASIITADEQVIIDEAMVTDAEPDAVKTAAITMFKIANRGRIDTDLSLMVQSGASKNDLMYMPMTGFTLRSGNSWYYQLPGQLILSFMDLGAIGIQDAGNSLQIAYTEDMETYSFYMGMDGHAGRPKCVGVNDFPFATFTKGDFAFETGDNEWLKSKRFYLESQLEVVNIGFTKSILQSAEITKQDGLYTVKMVVDCSVESKSSRTFQTAFAGPAAETDNGSPGMKRDYQSFEVTMEIWDTGYIRSYVSNEDYIPNGAQGTNSTVNGHETIVEVKLKYYWTEDEILALLKDDATVITKDTYLTSADEYLAAKIAYINSDGVKLPTMSGAIAKMVLSFAIVIACIVLLIVRVVNMSVEHGNLPKLKQRREKRTAKRQAKKNKNKTE